MQTGYSVYKGIYFETNKQILVVRREECSANIETGITEDSYFLPLVGSSRAARARLSWRPRAACTSIVSGEFVQCSNFSINPNNCIKAALFECCSDATICRAAALQPTLCCANWQT